MFRFLSTSLLASAVLLPSALADKTKVACVGDSITFGSGIDQREAHSYPKYLGDLMGPDYDVRNFGNPGKTCGDYPSQKQRGRWYGDTKEHQAAVAFQGDIYVGNLGINDTGAWWDPALFEKGYKDLIDAWRGSRKNVPVVIWNRLGPDFRGQPGKRTFPGNMFQPEHKYSNQDNGSAKNRPTAEKLLDKIAREKKTLTMDAYTALSTHPEFYKDGLHPLAGGARRLAELTYARLVPVLKVPQPKPSVTIGPDHTITVKNEGATGLLLDGHALVLDGQRTGAFTFGNATVVFPGDSLTIQCGAAQDQTDPVLPLASAKLKPAQGMKVQVVKVSARKP